MAKEQRTSSARVIGALVAVSLLGVAASIGAVAWLVSGQDEVEQGTVLELTIDGSFTEGPAADPLAELGLGGGGTDLWTIRRALRHATTDDAVAGVLVTVRTPALGMAQSHELVTELARFRDEGGKPVHVLLQTDLIDDGNYYVAAAGTKVWATPEAWWTVNGMQADVTFWRGTLEKLHVEPDVVMFKEYKSAGEAFANKEMSEPMREALTDVLGDVQDLWLSEVSTRRGIDREALQQVVNRGTITGPLAKEVGLVDELGFLDQVQDELKAAAGAEQYQGLAIGKYAKKLPEPQGEHRVAVVFGEGPIVSAAADESPFASGGAIHGPKVAEAIRKAAEDEDIDAIVFRVNSPGGSAVGSDLIWREIERAQEKGKPVVVSMSSVAGSGGYWVAMGADAIVAQPMTITGSIGVVFTKMNLRGLYEWAGANVESISFAENSDLLSPYSSLDESQREQIVASIGATYEDFVRKVAEGRGKTFDETEPLAHGRIYSGRDALEIGLVDALGGIDEAVGLASEKAGFAPSDAALVVYPEPKDFFQMLIEGELSEVRVGSPAPAEIERWLRQAATPRVQARMPDVVLR